MEENQYLYIGTKKELNECNREIDYHYIKKIVQSKKYDERYEYYYNNLSVNSQKFVNDTICTLTNKKEYLGYNLRQVIKWCFYSEKEFKTSLLADTIVIQDNLDDENYMNFIVDYDKTGLAKKIDELSKRASLKTKNMKRLIKNICDNLMITEDLIYKGEGYIYTIEQDELNSKDYKNFNDDMYENKYNTTIEFFKAYKLFLEDEYPNDIKRTSIIKKEYAKVKKNGAYFLLRDTKTYEKQAKCVNDLIAYLYSLENILR